MSDSLLKRIKKFLNDKTCEHPHPHGSNCHDCQNTGYTYDIEAISLLECMAADMERFELDKEQAFELDKMMKALPVESAATVHVLDSEENNGFMISLSQQDIPIIKAYIEKVEEAANE